MSDEVKKVTREKFKHSLRNPFLFSIILGGISYKHILEGIASDFLNDRILMFALAICSGGMSLITAFAVIRGILILKGVIQGNVEFVEEE
ncbi:hypothetical protein [Photobacterium galatheae]|uniref:Uncharacterized protein n=1 Tax=Photobacterium galatheae TaxID=1654360 RepID=A0A066RXW5_9GAMM|nr:hypothetical protein [Photobacterium galatheae]KDM92208.1 hypothetical protein EA58_06875 [Photobacterium galatheae]MCM0150612.1 hypothetical protein [Photobacterium galatheae]